MNIYYVYAYLRKKDITPYYIGKGKANRAWQKHAGLKIPNSKYRIIILENNLTNIGALALERRMIRWYGRKDNNTGILRNLTDGGEGTSGYPNSLKQKEKISKSLKGRTFTDNHKLNLTQAQLGTKNHRFGKKMSDEIKEKISKTLTGREVSDITRLKISKSLKGKIVRSEEWKRKQSESKIGIAGRKWSDESKQKLAESRRGKKFPKKK